MKIRDFEPNDRKAFITMAMDFYSGDATLFDMNEKYLNDTFDQSLEKSPLMRGIIIEDDGKIMGYALLAFYWSCEAGGLVVQLEDLYILREHRGKKIGSHFMDWLLEEYRGNAKRYRLEVCPRNPRVKKLYEGYGFKILDYQQMILEA